MIINITPEGLNDLKIIRDHVEDTTDCGPMNEGWKSPELQKAISTLEDIIQFLETTGLEDKK